MIGLEVPLALLGLALLAVPIAIHALVRRAPPVALLPTARFLDDVPRPRRRVSWPRDLVVLALRLLGLGALALAAGHPFVGAAAAPGPAPPALVLVLDDTCSMGAGAPASRLDRARRALLEELDALPPDGRAALLTTSSPRAPFEDRVRVRERLLAATPTVRSGSLVPALEAASELAREPGSAGIVVASDLDRASLEGIDRLGSLAHARLRVVDVGDDGACNAWLSSVELHPATPIAGFPLEVSARVGATGLDAATEVEASLALGGARQVVRARPGEVVRFKLPRAEAGVLAGELALHAPHDSLAADDRLSVAALVRPRLSVVVASERGAQHGADEPVARALAAVAEAEGAAIDVTLRAPAEVARGLDGARVLVLVAPGVLDEATGRAVDLFASSGGGLVVWLDERSVFFMRGKTVTRVGPALERAPGPLSRSAPTPLLGAFDPDVARGLQALALSPQAELEAQPGDAVLLRDAAGAPIWLESGRVALVGFAPTGRNEALARETVFPLLVRRALLTALGGPSGPLVPVGEPLDRRELARAAGAPLAELGRARLVGPSGEALPIGAGTLVPSTAGVHRVVSEAGETLAVFAARPPEVESSLERASASSRASLAAAGSGAPVREPEPAREDVTALVTAVGLAGLLLGSLVSNRKEAA